MASLKSYLGAFKTSRGITREVVYTRVATTVGDAWCGCCCCWTTLLLARAAVTVVTRHSSALALFTL